MPKRVMATAPRPASPSRLESNSPTHGIKPIPCATRLRTKTPNAAARGRGHSRLNMAALRRPISVPRASQPSTDPAEKRMEITIMSGMVRIRVIIRKLNKPRATTKTMNRIRVKRPIPKETSGWATSASETRRSWVGRNRAIRAASRANISDWPRMTNTFQTGLSPQLLGIWGLAGISGLTGISGRVGLLITSPSTLAPAARLTGAPSVTRLPWMWALSPSLTAPPKTTRSPSTSPSRVRLPPNKTTAPLTRASFSIAIEPPKTTRSEVRVSPLLSV